jgi:hypothetical protein|nr:MAG TPA: hypothetical protein [Caudoviricetes sp.]
MKNLRTLSNEQLNVLRLINEALGMIMNEEDDSKIVKHLSTINSLVNANNRTPIFAVLSLGLMSLNQPADNK